MHPTPTCTRASVQASVAWGVHVQRGCSAGLHGARWATWPETLVICFHGKTGPRGSLLWNGINLTGKVDSAPVACSIRGADAFHYSSTGFEIGIREILGGFKGYTHPRGLRRGPMASQHGGRAPDSSPFSAPP